MKLICQISITSRCYQTVGLLTGIGQGDFRTISRGFFGSLAAQSSAGSSFDSRQVVSLSFLQRQHPLKGGCDFVHEFPRGLKNANQLQFSDRLIRVFEVLSSTAEARCLTRVDRN